MKHFYLQIRAIALILLILWVQSGGLLAGKGGGPARIPRQAAIAMLQFQEALEQEEWTKALSFCSKEVKANSKEWESLEILFRQATPIDTIMNMRNFPYHTSKIAKQYKRYDLYIPLTEPNFEPIILWNCSLQETAGKWHIHFSPKPIHLDEMIQKKKVQIAARKQKWKQLQKDLEPKLRGVKTHLTKVSDEFVVGKPMRFKLELMNYGPHSLLYDDQQVAVNNSMVVLDDHKRRVPYIGGSFQTGGGMQELKPDSTVVLFESLDINKQYAIRKPGMYWIQFSGEPLTIGQKISLVETDDPSSNVISTTTQFPSNIIRLEVQSRQADVSPSKTVTDLQCRLKPDQTVWKDNETPKFIADVPPPRIKHIWLNAVQEQSCQVEIDGDWYRWIGPQWYNAMFVPYPSDWLSNNRGYLRLTLNQDYWQNVNNEKPLTLSLGEHTIRLAWAGRLQKEEIEKPIQVLSNPVKIKILPSFVKYKKLTPAEKHRKRVTDSFRLFREYPPSEKKEETGFDLRFFGEGYPIYTWQDIPILLELAQSDKVLLGRNIPKLVISSHIQQQCREGMIALWLIEGLRRQQEFHAKRTPRNKHEKTRPYYLPLNPMCRKEGMKSDDCENSAELHQEVLQAYRTWWQQVKDLPPKKASLKYPLEKTNIRWHGGGVDFAKNR